jgi:hypothetical protein
MPAMGLSDLTILRFSAHSQPSVGHPVDLAGQGRRLIFGRSGNTMLPLADSPARAHSNLFKV